MENGFTFCTSRLISSGVALDQPYLQLAIGHNSSSHSVHNNAEAATTAAANTAQTTDIIALLPPTLLPLLGAGGEGGGGEGSFPPIPSGNPPPCVTAPGTSTGTLGAAGGGSASLSNTAHVAARSMVLYIRPGAGCSATMAVWPSGVHIAQGV